MRRWRIAAWGLVSFAVIAVGAPAAVPPTWLGALVASQLESVLSTPARVERAWVWPWSGVWLQDVQLDGPEGRPLGGLDRAELRIRPWRWLTGAIVVDRLSIEGLSLRVERTGKGWNLPAPAPSDPPQAPVEGPVRLPVPVRLESVLLNDLQVSLRDGALTATVTMDRLKASASGRGTDVQVRLRMLRAGAAWTGLDPERPALDAGRLTLAATATAALDLRRALGVRDGALAARLKSESGVGDDSFRWRADLEARADFEAGQGTVAVFLGAAGQRLSLAGEVSGLRQLLKARLGWAGTSWADRLGLGTDTDASGRLAIEGDGAFDVARLPVPEALSVEPPQGRVHLDGLRLELAEQGLPAGRGRLRLEDLSWQTEAGGVRALGATLAARTEPSGAGRIDSKFHWSELVGPGVGHCGSGRLRLDLERESARVEGGEVDGALSCRAATLPGVHLESLDLSVAGRTSDFGGGPGLVPGRWVASSTVARLRWDRTPAGRLQAAGLRLRAAVRPEGSRSTESAARWRTEVGVRVASVDGPDLAAKGMRVDGRADLRFEGPWPTGPLDGDGRIRVRADRLRTPGEVAFERLDLRGLAEGRGFAVSTTDGSDPLGVGPRPGALRLEARAGRVRWAGRQWSRPEMSVRYRRSRSGRASLQVTLPDELALSLEGRFRRAGRAGRVHWSVSAKDLSAWSLRVGSWFGGLPSVEGALDLTGDLAYRSASNPFDSVEHASIRMRPDNLSVRADGFSLERLGGDLVASHRPGGFVARGGLVANGLEVAPAGVRARGVALQVDGGGRRQKARGSVRLLVEDAEVGADRWRELRSELGARVGPRGIELTRLALDAPWNGVRARAAGRVGPPARGSQPWGLTGTATLSVQGDRLAQALGDLNRGAGRVDAWLRLEPTGPGDAEILGAAVADGLTLEGEGLAIRSLTGELPFRQGLRLDPVAGSDSTLKDPWVRARQALDRWSRAQLRLAAGNILVDAPRSADYDALRPYQRQPSAPSLQARSLRFGETSCSDVKIDARWDSGLLSVERLAFGVWQGDALLDLAMQLTAEPNVRARLRGTATGVNLDIPYAAVFGTEADLEVPNPFTTSAVLDLRFDLDERTLDGTADLARVTEPLLERAFGALELESARRALAWLRRAERLGVRPRRGRIWIRNNLLSAEFDFQRLWLHVAYQSPVPWDVLLDTVLIPGRLVTIPIAGAPVINIVNSAVRRFSIGGLVDAYVRESGALELLDLLAPRLLEDDRAGR